MNISKISKTFLYITIVSFTIWTGAALAKTLLTYNFFVPPTFELKSFLNSSNLTVATSLLAPVYALSISAAATFFAFFVFFVVTSKLSLRLNGWLFISTIIVVLLFSAEISLYFLYDRYFINSVFWGTPDGAVNMGYIIKRFENFSSFPIIELLSAFSLIYLFLFQPLKKHEN